MTKNRIETTPVYPPISDHSHDWYAKFKADDGDTELYGEGETEEAAVLAFLKKANEEDGDGGAQELIVDMAFSFWKLTNAAALDWQDVRLFAGEGDLTGQAVLDGANAALRNRLR